MTMSYEPLAGTRPDRLPGVEIRHLSALRAIALEGSFRGAADSLGYVQSAVSHQVAMLERLVGARLVERSRGNAEVSLTEAGHLLLVHAGEILARFDAAHAQITELIEERAGTLRVGAFHSVAVNLLPRVMSAFTREYPAFRIQATERESSASLLELLDDGQLDIAFCGANHIDGPFESLEMMDDPFVLLVPAHSPLAPLDEPPTLAEIATMPLIGVRSSPAQEQVSQALAEHDPCFVFQTDLDVTVQALVAADFGVAIVPYLAVDPLHPGTNILELPELPARTITLIRHRDQKCPPATIRFIEMVRAACPRFLSARVPKKLAA